MPAPTDLSQLARSGDLRRLQDALGDLDVPAVVDELGRADPATRALVFRALPKDRSLAVFEDLEPALQGELLRGLRAEATSDLITGLDPDDRAELLDELPASVAARLLSGLSAREREMTTALLGYPPDSAGRRMTPEVVDLPVDVSVGRALELVRAGEPDAETIYTLPVTGPGRCVLGVVSLRRLLVSDDDAPLQDVMNEAVVVRTSDDQEVAARVVREHGLVAVPVVDAENRLVGLFTVDDAMRVLEREETEDIARAGGAEPLDRPYLASSLFAVVRSRVVWLLVLIIGATLTVNVLDYFEDVLAEVVALALFVPLLIGTGGNTGAQAVTTVIRAMAVGDVRFRDLPRVVGRELVTGAMLGALLAAVGFGPAAWLVGAEIATVLCLALVVVCALATTAGALTPLLARRIGVDPAVVSAPFITTFVDATGLVVYFLIARAVLGL
ncbi:magnesium transporter [Blastococcus sp. PRF04-17]|uniref:magnesium transporter n=1 Tax=Blastococcus sp. PRF04-17 TaxID=2933797 RepID=UPI001FF3E82A|nr:magnesium transporter [Blastococcus sp. PRF04-17]UOY02022.1 magnesium transporter [Blastococcus sp. PRF04-17]